MGAYAGALPRPSCDGSPSASVRSSLRQTSGPPCPYPSARPPPDATMKPVNAPSVWSSHSDLGKKKSGGRNPPQGFAPNAHRDEIGAPDFIISHFFIHTIARPSIESSKEDKPLCEPRKSEYTHHTYLTTGHTTQPADSHSP